MSDLTRLRRSTSARLRGLEIPDAFAVATSASLARILAKPTDERTSAQKRDARRIARQEMALAARGGT